MTKISLPLTVLLIVLSSSETGSLGHLQGRVTMAKKKCDFNLLTKIVRRRGKIQAASLALIEVVETAKLIGGDKGVSQLLVGGSFSLWRAAFLLDAERGEEQISADG